MVSTTLSLERICPQLVRRASDHNSGRRKIGRIRCGEMVTVSMPGMKMTGATTTVKSAGHGRPVRSPTAATRTVGQFTVSDIRPAALVDSARLRHYSCVHQLARRRGYFPQPGRRLA